MNNLCTQFQKNNELITMYDLVLAEHPLDDGMTPGEVTTMAGQMSGPFEPVKFEGNNSIAMGYITVKALELLNDRIPATRASDQSVFYWDELEMYILSILDDMNYENPYGRYKFVIKEKETTLQVLLLRDVNLSASTMMSALELSIFHVKPETFAEMLTRTDLQVYPKIIDGTILGSFVNVPYNTVSCPKLPSDLMACIKAATEVEADWIMFNAKGRYDPNLPCYIENW